MKRFLDRRDADRFLAQRLMHHARRPDVLVLALPCGGVPVGYEVLWYEDFTQVEDSEVQALLAAARGRIRSSPALRDAEHLRR